MWHSNNPSQQPQPQQQQQQQQVPMNSIYRSEGNYFVEERYISPRRSRPARIINTATATGDNNLGIYYTTAPTVSLGATTTTTTAMTSSSASSSSTARIYSPLSTDLYPPRSISPVRVIRTSNIASSSPPSSTTTTPQSVVQREVIEVVRRRSNSPITPQQSASSTTIQYTTPNPATTNNSNITSSSASSMPFVSTPSPYIPMHSPITATTASSPQRRTMDINTNFTSLLSSKSPQQPAQPPPPPQTHIFSIVTTSSSSARSCISELLERFPNRVSKIRAICKGPQTLQDLDLPASAKGKVDLISNVSLEKPETLRPVFQGSSGAFIILPMDMSSGSSRDAELVLILNGIIDAAIAGGVGHVVFVGSWAVNEPKAVSMTSSRFLAAEALLREKEYSHKLKWTVLRAGFFCSNLATMLAVNVKERAQVIFPEKVKFAPVDAADVGRCAAVVLVEGPSMHHGKCFELSGSQMVDGHVIAASLSAQLNKKIDLCLVAIDDFTEELPPPISQMLSFCAQQGELAIPFTRDVQVLIGSQNGFDDWLRQHLQDFQEQYSIAILPNFGEIGVACLRELLEPKHLSAISSLSVLCWNAAEANEANSVVKSAVNSSGDSPNSHYIHHKVKIQVLQERNWQVLSEALVGCRGVLLPWPLDITGGVSHDAELLMILSNMVECSISSKVEYIVMTSSCTVNEPTLLSMSAARFLGAEALLKEKQQSCGLKYTILRSTMSFDFLMAVTDAAIRERGQVMLPEGVEMAAVCSWDVGRCAAVLLARRGQNYHGLSLDLNGPEMLDAAKIAHHLSQVYQTRVGTTCLPLSIFLENVPPPLGQFFQYCCGKGKLAFTNNNNVLDISSQHTTLQQWLARKLTE